MLRDAIIFALYEEITSVCPTYQAANLYVTRLNYLTLDESFFLLERLVDWYGV